MLEKGRQRKEREEEEGRHTQEGAGEIIWVQRWERSRDGQSESGVLGGQGERGICSTFPPGSAGGTSLNRFNRDHWDRQLISNKEPAEGRGWFTDVSVGLFFCDAARLDQDSFEVVVIGGLRSLQKCSTEHLLIAGESGVVLNQPEGWLTLAQLLFAVVLSHRWADLRGDLSQRAV